MSDGREEREERKILPIEEGAQRSREGHGEEVYGVEL